MIQKITAGLSSAGTIANEMLKDKKIRKDIIELGPRASGLVSALVTVVNAPETTSLAQKAVLSLGVGSGTMVIAALAMGVPVVISIGALFGLKKISPENYSKINKDFGYSATGVMVAGCITAAAIGGYKGHHVLTDVANDLMSHSHISASSPSVLRP